MRRSQVLAVLTALLLLTGLSVALRRLGTEADPTAGPTPTPTVTTPGATPTATPSPARTVTPSPAGKGPRNDEYDVVYAATVTPDDGAFAVAAANGVIVREVPQVGVVTVRAGKDFLTRARKDKRIFGVFRNPAVGVPPEGDEGAPRPSGRATRRTGSGNDPLSDLQWDMDLMDVPRAHRVEAGDRRVLVAVIDTGVDRTHPDLVKAYDRTLSRNFVTDYPGADGPCEESDCVDPVGIDPAGHGTHVAGTIAAAADGFGMVGVAPGVRLVDLRAGQDSGFFFLRPTTEALVYAADIGVDVANLSYFVDPWLFNCPDSPDDSSVEQYQQRALLEGVRRAVDYAYRNGVTLVAAAGNEAMDLDDPRVDTSSPNFPRGTARDRRIDDDCEVLPTTLPKVIQVSSLARDRIKARYSNYGLEHIDVTAPGGSPVLANGDQRLENLALSTWPAASLAIDRNGTVRDEQTVTYCRGDRCAHYRYLAGTSMASPHAAGVAALIVSRYGKADPRHPGQLTMAPAEVERILVGTAEPLACPADRQTYASGPQYTARCTGTRERNSFYGHGVVNALAAVSR